METTKTTKPHDWGSGPPKTEIESWNWERRRELVSISHMLLASMLTKQAEPDGPHQEPDDASLVRRALEMAKGIQVGCDALYPKL